MDHADQMRNCPAGSANLHTVLAANAANNARGDGARRRRWKPARAAAWALLDDEIAQGARVAVAGAGNGDDLPLLRLARRARRLDLTGGAAEAVLTGAPPVDVPVAPVGDGPYDVVVCDLVLTQLLYPALKAVGTFTGAEVDARLLRDGQRITDGVIARLHAAAPSGAVIILHDLLGWWDGHRQPFTLEELLAAPDPAAALTLARRGSLPYGCDPWLATERAGAHVTRTALWRWPFAPGADYAIFGLVTRRGRS